ncbi:hypothetical protein [Streptomyces roseicoloratus]|uniref:hypothetical protein n=1 Tax=Streptomyces roseicoloratus TaxID=2508722 RepID=UPI001009A6CD|nr:hypothetical protein [Streptomyces roseicoloratus]
MLPEITGARQRLALARLTTGLAILNTLWHLPPGDALVDEWSRKEAGGDGRPSGRLSAEQYEALRRLAFVSTAAWTLGAESKALKFAANASFAAVQRHVAQFDQRAWNYNSNLNVYLLLLSLTDSRGSLAEAVGEGADDGTGDGADGGGSSPDVATAVLLAMRLYYGCLYFQSGLSKVLLSGPAWADGRTLRGSWAELGNRAGKWLSRRPMAVAAAASAATLAFELLFPAAQIALRKRPRAVGLSSLAFHASIKATMGISFWHHAVHALPLFVLDPGAERHTARLLRPFRRR